MPLMHSQPLEKSYAGLLEKSVAPRKVTPPPRPKPNPKEQLVSSLISGGSIAQLGEAARRMLRDPLSWEDPATTVVQRHGHMTLSPTGMVLPIGILKEGGSPARLPSTPEVVEEDEEQDFSQSQAPTAPSSPSARAPPSPDAAAPPLTESPAVRAVREHHPALQPSARHLVPASPSLREIILDEEVKAVREQLENLGAQAKMERESLHEQLARAGQRIGGLTRELRAAHAAVGEASSAAAAAAAMLPWDNVASTLLERCSTAVGELGTRLELHSAGLTAQLEQARALHAAELEQSRAELTSELEQSRAELTSELEQSRVEHTYVLQEALIARDAALAALRDADRAYSELLQTSSGACAALEASVAQADGQHLALAAEAATLRETISDCRREEREVRVAAELHLIASDCVSECMLMASLIRRAPRPSTRPMSSRPSAHVGKMPRLGASQRAWRPKQWRPPSRPR